MSEWREYNSGMTGDNVYPSTRSARFSKLKAEFEAQLEEEARLNQLIIENWGRIQL